MNKIKILLAEDHIFVRESIRQALERDESLEVIGEAGDGEEAVKMTIQFKPDIVIMDISMPRLNGIKATKQIKTVQPSTAILVLTAYDYEQYIFPLLEVGAAGYLLKDVKGDQLINAVHTVYQGDAVLHPAITRKVLQRLSLDTTEIDKNKTSDLLSERETGVLKMAAKGMSNKDIADELHLSIRTVENHLGCIFSKMGVASRTEAVIQAMRHGWFNLEDIS